MQDLERFKWSVKGFMVVSKIVECHKLEVSVDKEAQVGAKINCSVLDISLLAKKCHLKM